MPDLQSELIKMLEHLVRKIKADDNIAGFHADCQKAEALIKKAKEVSK